MELPQELDEAEPPRVPGFSMDRLLGRGASGAVWLAVPDGGGPPLALKCVRPGMGGIDGLAELERELLILSRYVHPHVLGVHGAVALEGSVDAAFGLLLDYAPGGSLRQLMAARGVLRLGEVVTMLVPLAQALEYLHSEGVIHGDLSPGNVLFSVGGMPLLADLGVGRLVGDGEIRKAGTPGFSAPDPSFDGGPRTWSAAEAAAGDVYALAALGWYALTGSPPAATAQRVPLPLCCPSVPLSVAALLDAGLAENWLDRPLPGQIAGSLYRCARAEPIDLSLAVDPSVLPDLPTRHALPPDRRIEWLRRRRQEMHPHRRLPPLKRPRIPRGQRVRLRPRTLFRRRFVVTLAAAAVVLALAVALVEGVLPGQPTWRVGDGVPKSTAQDVAPPDPLAAVALPAQVRAQLLSTDPRQALAGLVWLRAYALATGAPDLLALVNAPDSPAAVTDGALAARLQADRHVLAGLESSIRQARIVPAVARDQASAVVQAVAAMSGFSEQDPAGTVVAAQTSGSLRQLRFYLVRSQGRWLIQAVGPSQ